MKFQRAVSFDIEVFPEYFVCVLAGKKFHLEDIEPLRCAMSRDDRLYVGFNIVSYDTIVLAYAFLASRNNCLNFKALKQVSDWIIEGVQPIDDFAREFCANSVDVYTVTAKGQTRTSHRLVYGAMWANIALCDLYLVGNKKGGLKKAAVVLDCDDLSECPIPFDKTNLSEEEKVIVDDYCVHDYKVTDLAYAWHIKQGDIGVRELFSEENDIDDAFVLGAAALSEKYFKNRAIKQFGSKFLKVLDNHKEWRKHSLPDVSTLDLIRCGELKFQDRGFSEFQTMIRGTHFNFEGGISASSATESEDFDEDYADMSNSAFLHKGKSVPKGALIITDSRNHKYQFGVGGLHDISLMGVWEEDERRCLRFVDVKSYYPSLIDSWRISPRHFPSYCDEIAACLAVRLEAKKDEKLKGKANALKLAMNSSFGKLKDRYCSLFDPFAHFSVTLTGQMGLLYLIDRVYKACPSAEVVNANTDGICFRLDRSEEGIFQLVCGEWERVMRVSLEFESYKKWVQKSCNLYCALLDCGNGKTKIKAKGVSFKLEPTDLGEGFKMARAVKRMVIEHMLYGKGLVEIARGLEPKMFLLSSSCGAKTRMVYDGKVLENRTSIRYVFGNKGKELGVRNTATGKISSIKDGARVILVDKLSDLKMEDIRIERYVAMARQIVNEILKSDEKKTVMQEGFFGMF